MQPAKGAYVEVRSGRVGAPAPRPAPRRPTATANTAAYDSSDDEPPPRPKAGGFPSYTSHLNLST